MGNLISRRANPAHQTVYNPLTGCLQRLKPVPLSLTSLEVRCHLIPLSPPIKSRIKPHVRAVTMLFIPSLAPYLVPNLIPPNPTQLRPTQLRPTPPHIIPTPPQMVWLYLEPIFGSEDIMQQMPTEGRRFQTVDRTWRKIMEEAKATPAVMTAMQTPGLLQRLQECNEKLELIQKGLNDYLETKRLSFPRFFFLSNDELLQILSETKDPLRVQPFLKKCFEAINRLDFSKDLTISAMYSEENERVAFRSIIDPAKAKGNVEKWLIEIELGMRAALKAIMAESIAAYAKRPRVEWIV